MLVWWRGGGWFVVYLKNLILRHLLELLDVSCEGGGCI